MPNPFFSHSSGWPIQGSRGTSSPGRSDMDAVASGFDLAWMRLVDVGTVNQIVVTPPTGLVSLTDGLGFEIKVLNTNTGATTITIGTLGTFTAKYVDGTSLQTGALISGQWYSFKYNSTSGTLQFVPSLQTVAANGLPLTGGTMAGPINEFEGANIASAATIDLGGATGNFVHITGSATISAITLPQGYERHVVFDSAPTLVHSSTLFLNNAGSNIQCAANDTAIFRGDTGGVVRLIAYSKASGREVSDMQSVRNFVHNSAFDIAQRGATYALTTSIAYGSADRWAFLMESSAQGIANVVSAGLTGFSKCLKIGRNAASVLTSPIWMMQSLESADSIKLQGKTVTISFYAKAGANFSAFQSLIGVWLRTGTGTDQAITLINGSWTGAASPIAGASQAITTTWTRYQMSASIASTATQVGVEFVYVPVGTAGADDNFYITGIQLEIGSRATDYVFQPSQQELALCQRYYYRSAPGVASASFGVGYANTTTVAAVHTPFPVPMRIAPSALEQDGTAGDYSVFFANTATACSVVPAFASATINQARTTFTVAAGLTAGQGGEGRTTAATTAGYLGWSADL